MTAKSITCPLKKMLKLFIATWELAVSSIKGCHSSTIKQQTNTQERKCKKDTTKSKVTARLPTGAAKVHQQTVWRVPFKALFGAVLDILFYLKLFSYYLKSKSHTLIPDFQYLWCKWTRKIIFFFKQSVFMKKTKKPIWKYSSVSEFNISPTSFN